MATRVARAKAGQWDEEEEVPVGSVPTLVVHDERRSAIYAFAVARKGSFVDAIVRLRVACIDPVLVPGIAMRPAQQRWPRFQHVCYHMSRRRTVCGATARPRPPGAQRERAEAMQPAQQQPTRSHKI